MDNKHLERRGTTWELYSTQQTIMHSFPNNKAFYLTSSIKELCNNMYENEHPSKHHNDFEPIEQNVTWMKLNM